MEKTTVGTISVALLALGALLAGCAAGGSGQNQTSVGVSLNSLEYPMVVIMNDAMNDSAADQDASLQVVDSRNSVSTELSQVEDLITKQPQVIIMNPVDAESSQGAGRLVNQAGIPLVTIDNNFSEDADVDVDAYIGSDATESGRLQAQFINEQFPDGAQIIYLVGIYGAPWTERRMEGFYGELNDNITVATETEAQGSRADAKTVTEDLLRRYSGKGEIDAIVAINDEMAIGALSAVAEAGRSEEFVVIGADGQDSALEAVEQGTLTATVAQDPVTVGAKALEIAIAVARGDKVEKVNHIAQTVVTAENVEDFKR